MLDVSVSITLEEHFYTRKTQGNWQPAEGDNLSQLTAGSLAAWQASQYLNWDKLSAVKLLPPLSTQPWPIPLSPQYLELDEKKAVSMPILLDYQSWIFNKIYKINKNK